MVRLGARRLRKPGCRRLLSCVWTSVNAVFLGQMWDHISCPPKLLSSTGGFRTVRQTGKPEVRAPAAPVPPGVAVTYTRLLHSVGSSSLSSSRTGPWAWFTPQSVCTRDNWEAIWLSFRCRGMNVVFWGILQLFVSCLLSPDKWSHFSSAWSLLERTRIQALKFALTVWKHMSCWPWIGHLEDSSRFKTC